MEDLKRAAVEAVEPLAPYWFELSDRIHANPEFNFNEYKASKWLCEAFEKLGFTAELGAGGIDTAFTAVLDSKKPGPSVGIIIEYDAIEGLGHACAHNTKGPAVLCGIEAFLKTCPDFRGKIIAFGCPAEEGGGGKIIMTEAGVFKAADVCLELGVGPDFGTGSKVLARQGLTLTSIGKSAHAGLRHLPSINALDSLLFVLGSLDYLRKHLGTQGIINAIIEDGGKNPAVIPGRAVVQMEVRATKKAILEKYVDAIERLVHISQSVSGARIDVKKSLTYLDYVKCPSLATMVMNNFRELGIEAEWLLDMEPRGSSDVGNVSHTVPTETIYIGLQHGLVPHTPEYREAAGGEPGHRAIVNGGKMLAMCLIDLLVHDSDELLQRARHEFESARIEE